MPVREKIRAGLEPDLIIGEQLEEKRGLRGRLSSMSSWGTGSSRRRRLRLMSHSWIPTVARRRRRVVWRTVPSSTARGRRRLRGRGVRQCQI